MRNYRFQGDKLMDHSSRNTPLILTPLVVNIVIISAILVRIGYLYNKSMNAYSWILGTAIMALLCAIALYAFIGGYVLKLKVRSSTNELSYVQSRFT